MAAIILVIVSAGILTAGHLLGWFDGEKDVASLTGIRGIVTMERSGIRYTVEKEIPLRPDDVLTVETGGSATVRIGDSELVLNAGATIQITNPAQKEFSARIDSGEVFCRSKSELTLSFAEQTLELKDVTALFSIRLGAQSAGVLSGSVGSASAGQQINWIGGKESLVPLQKESLNAFAIGCIRETLKAQPLCFSAGDLDMLEADRLAAEQKELEAQLNPTVHGSSTTPGQDVSESSDPLDPGTEPPADTEPAPAETEPAPAETEPPADIQSGPAETKPAPSQTEPVSVETAPTPSQTEPDPTETEPNSTCTITIRCDTILNNMNSLVPDKAGLVPPDGVLLYPTTVTFSPGETVFDVLRRVCDTAGIALEYEMSVYGSYYVEGIGGIYAFDCGSESGWMYKVNEWFPNYGCSDYILADGDNIVWCYSCSGYGTDVGAPAW